MVNSGITFDFVREGSSYNLSAYSSFNKNGVVTYSISPTATINDAFKFPFFNIVQNAPFRSVIYNESFTKLGAEIYFDKEMANTWITLARIYDAFIRKGYTIQSRISYDKCYVHDVFYISDHGVDYLFLEKYTNIDSSTPFTLEDGSDYLIHYPIIFKKTNTGYYSISPINSFDRIIRSTSLSPLYDSGDGYKVYRIEVYDLQAGINGLPVYQLNNGRQIPNIIPSKFNIDVW